MRVVIAPLSLSLCLAAPSALAGEWSTRTEAGMQTHVFTPDAAGAVGAGRALLVTLHGCTQSNESLRDRGNFEAAAEAYGVVVAVPDAPNGGVIAGCWDYYGTNHSRTTRHADNVLGLVQALSTDATLDVDPDQVYVAGLSSGGGQAAVLGCLAPDVFAGVGVNAGPAVGTGQSDIAFVSTTAAAARATCERLAGAESAALATQVASVINGDRDFVVAGGYADLNAEMYVALAGGGLTAASLDVSSLEGYEPAGVGTEWADGAGPRVSRIEVAGMGHAFPAGSGSGFELGFVASEGPSWPMYLASFFAANNRRVNRAPPPVDGGVDPDAGSATDAGSSPDATAAPDGGAGADAAVPAPDAGSPPDAGQAAVDAGGTEDAGATSSSDRGEGCRGGGGAGWPLLSLASGLAAAGIGRSRRRRRGRARGHVA